MDDGCGYFPTMRLALSLRVIRAHNARYACLFNELSFHDFQGDLLRNIKSIRKTQNLFDDLSEDPADQNIAIQTELDTKLPFYTDIPIIKRPYEEAKIFNANSARLIIR